MKPSWRNLAAAGLAICLVALVLHPTAAGAAALAAMVLLPSALIGLFGLVDVPQSLGSALQLETVFATPVLVRAGLFQRPPPVSPL
jgi:hypothetical protein